MLWKPDELSRRIWYTSSTDSYERYEDGGNEGWTAGAIYLFYLGWFWTGIGDLDGLVGRQPPGVPLDVDAGVHSGLLLRLPCPSSFLAASSSRQRFPEVPRVTPGPLLGPRSYTTNPQFLTWNGREGVSVKIDSICPARNGLFAKLCQVWFRWRGKRYSKPRGQTKYLSSRCM